MTSRRHEPAAPERAPRTEVTVQRQPVVNPDRTVRGYAVNVVVGTPRTRTHIDDEIDALVDAQYDLLDFAALAGGCAVFVRATPRMLTCHWPRTDVPGGLVLEVPRDFAEQPDAVGHLRRLRADGVDLALADFVPGGRQDVLLPLVDFVKVDLGRGDDVAACAIGQAHASGTAVIAERVDSEFAVGFCATHAVELLQGPLFQRDATPTAREFTTGEVQCLALMTLLIADEIDQGRVIRVIGSDPELTMRVLGLVNSSAVSARHRIDSVRRAVVMLGPQPLASLAMASLVGSRSHTIAGLWFMLTRAVACRSIACNDAAYTVGLLSAAASALRVAPADLVARTKVSDDVGDALLTLTGPYGPVLAGVLAHEENDIAGVAATGLDPVRVAGAYLAAVADARATAEALAARQG